MNRIVTCPYDKSHRILRSTLPYHLTRCSVNNSSLKKKQCPFDAYHIIDEDYFENHIINCASSGNVKRYMYNLEPPCQLGTIPLESVRNLSVPIMRDWIEEPVETYDPWKSTENRNIIRCKVGGSKSQKKQYKLAERKRIQNLEKENICKPNLATCFKHKPVKQCFNVLTVIDSLQRLSLDDLDVLLESIDFGNLYINKHEQDINTMLVEKFKNMLLYCWKKEIS